MVVFPPCKINLGLNIIEKRIDGYHNLETCFYPVPWTDILEIIPSSKLSFSTSGDAIPGKPEENLCLKAYYMLRDEHQLPAVQIHLHKILPTGAGLGGGSSDAAYTLRLLNEIFELNLSAEQLSMYAARLGSDCAFFIQDHPMMGISRGDVLQEVAMDLKKKYLVIVKPNVHISTAEAYAGVTPQEPEVSLKDMLETQPIEKWKDVVKNDFEETIFRNHPDIKKIKQRLYEAGALYASMSGSGSAVYGIFEKETEVNGIGDYIRWRGML